MFPRAKRLARVDFPAALRSEKRISSEHFSVVFAKTEGYAVVVSKTIAKSSVVRHRIKRRVSEVLKRLPIPPSLVVFARPRAAPLTSAMIEEELRALLARAR